MLIADSPSRWHWSAISLAAVTVRRRSRVPPFGRRRRSQSRDETAPHRSRPGACPRSRCLQRSRSMEIRGGTPVIPTKPHRHVQLALDGAIYALRNRIEREAEQRAMGAVVIHNASSPVGSFDPSGSRTSERQCELAAPSGGCKALLGNASATPYQTGAVQSFGDAGANREHFGRAGPSASPERCAKTRGVPGLLSPSQASGECCAGASWRRERNRDPTFSS